MRGVAGTAVKPHEAKAVWDSLEAPNVNKVVRALAASGKKVSNYSVWTWRKNNWAPTGLHHTNLGPESYSVESLDLSLPALTGDAATRVADLMAALEATKDPTKELTIFQEGLTPLARAIVNLPDHELLTESHRSILQVVMLASHMALRTPDEFARHPAEMGTLLKAIAFCTQVVSESLERSQGMVGSLRKQTDAKVEPEAKGAQTVYPPGEDPLNNALRSIRQPMKRAG